MAKLMDLHETMKYIGVSKATFYRLAQGKKIPVIKIGGRWRVDRERLDAWMKKSETVSNQQTQCTHYKKKKLSTNKSAKVFTRREIQNYLKFSKQAIYKMVQTGQIPAFKENGEWRFKKSEIDKWLLEKENLENHPS